MLAACTALAALAIMATRTPALGQRIPLVMGAGILIMALRRWPSPMLAVTAAAVAIVMTTGGASLPQFSDVGCLALSL